MVERRGSKAPLPRPDDVGSGWSGMRQLQTVEIDGGDILPAHRAGCLPLDDVASVNGLLRRGERQNWGAGCPSGGKCRKVRAASGAGEQCRALGATEIVVGVRQESAFGGRRELSPASGRLIDERGDGCRCLGPPGWRCDARSWRPVPEDRSTSEAGHWAES